MDNNHIIEDLLGSVPTLDLAFRQLCENNIPFDCIIICSDNLRIKAHKRYLCAYSNHFEFEFGSDLKSREKILIDAPSNIVLKLLDFLYTSTIDKDQPIEDTQELLRLSHTYNFSVLKARMSGLLVGCFTPSNVCELCNFGRTYQAAVIRRAGARYIAMNVEHVERQTPGWKKIIDAQCLRLVEKWLLNDTYHAPSNALEN